MLRLALIGLFVAFLISGRAQNSQDSLRKYNQEMYGFNKKAWLTVGGVSLVGAGVSVPGILLSEDTQMKSFHQMNVIYYGLNLAFAVPGYLAARKSYRKSFNEKETYLAQIRQEKTYLFNTGLDVFYLASGFLVRSIGKRYPENEAIFQGVGNSLIVQSAFLFAVDLTMTLAHTRHRKKFDKMVQWGISGNGIGLKVNL